MNIGSLDAQGARRAPPVGRVLRILIGLGLIAQVTPVYFHVDSGLAIGAVLLILGLVAVYSLLHVVVSRRLITLGPGLGAVVGLGTLAAVYLAGAPGDRSWDGEKGSSRQARFSASRC